MKEGREKGGRAPGREERLRPHLSLQVAANLISGVLNYKALLDR